MTRSRLLLRALAGVVVFAGLAGATPGNVGGCGQTNGVVGAPQHCVERDTWSCVRERSQGRWLTPDKEQFCAEANIQSRCSGATWPEGCLPTEDQSQACIDLLSNRDLVTTPVEELLMTHTECNLCTP